MTTTTTTQTYTTTNPPFNTNKTTTGRRKPTPRANQPAPAQHDQLLGGTWHPMSLSFFPTTNRFVISSLPQQQQQHQTYTTTNPPFNTNKQNNNRSLATRTSSASSYLCWRHRVLYFRYATSDNTRHSHRPPHTHLLFVSLLRCLLSTSFIFSHTADTFIVTTTPNSPPTLYPFFPSDNLSSYNLTGLPQSRSPDTLRTQPYRWRFSWWCLWRRVHRRRKRPTIARRGP